MYNGFVSDANLLGAIEGEKTHQQTVDELAKHLHVTAVGVPYSAEDAHISSGPYLQVAGIKAHSWTIEEKGWYEDSSGVKFAGGNIPFSIMQPSLYLNQIIKI